MQESFVSIEHTDLPRRRVKKCVIWVLQEAGAKVGLNMPGFNRENACDRPRVGSWHGWDCQQERKEERSSGGCILVGLAEVYPGGQEVLEWKSAAGAVLCHPGTSCLGIAAVWDPGLGPAWGQCSRSANSSWVSGRSSWSQVCSL